MRIADVADFYAEAGGGVKTYMDAKLAAGAQHGHEVVVIAPGPEDREVNRNGGRVIWIKSPPVPGDSRYHILTSKKRVHAALDRVQPDIVEGSSPYGGGWFAGSWMKAAVRSFVFHQDPVAALLHPLLDKYIATAHLDGIVAQPVWSYLRRLASCFDTTVVAGQWLQERLGHFGLPRVQAVPFGIDAVPFLKAQPSSELRQRWLEELGLGPEGTVLVAVSRHHFEKRLPVLIHAVSQLPSSIGLVIYGDGPARAQVEKVASTCSRVSIAGYTRDREALATAMCSADAFVHGSAAETYGLVVSEAIAAGLPMVVPAAGGAKDLVSEAFSEMYPPGDAQGCTEAIQRLLRRDKTLMLAALKNARAEVRTLSTHFEELFSHYEARAKSLRRE